MVTALSGIACHLSDFDGLSQVVYRYRRRTLFCEIPSSGHPVPSLRALTDGTRSGSGILCQQLPPISVGKFASPLSTRQSGN